MAKAMREIGDSITLVDAVVELLDARIPESSRNPKLYALAGKKPVLVILNKADLADPGMTRRWEAVIRNSGTACVSVNSEKGTGIGRVKELIFQSAKEKLDREEAKGRNRRAVRVMVVGIPNVGKSSLINRLCGKAGAPVADRPGVTRGRKWIRIDKNIELLDTPGVLPPRLDDRQTGIKLAWTGAIRDSLLDPVQLAGELLLFMSAHYPDPLCSRYGLPPDLVRELSAEQLLNACGKARGCLRSGGIIDEERISAILLDEFRAGRLGHVTLDFPP